METALNQKERKQIGVLKQLGATDDNIRCIVGALDPFHDVEIEHAGWPDARGGRSIIYEYTRQISVPIGAHKGAGARMQVVMTPGLEPSLCKKLPSTTTNSVKGLYNLEGGCPVLCDNNTGEFAYWGGCIIMSSTLGEDFSIANYDVSHIEGILRPFSSETSPDMFGDEHNSSQYRCIGSAFEVLNTTPELYKSGSALAYRMDDEWEDDVVTRSDPLDTMDPAVPYQVRSTTVQVHPKNSSEARLMPSSIVLAAADGVYSVSKMTCVENLPLAKHDSQLLVYNRLQSCREGPGDYEPTPAIVSQAIGMAPTSLNGVAVAATRQYMARHLTHGYIAEGLSSETSFLITAKWLIEVFPEPTDTVLLPIAKPCPTFSPISLEYLNVAFSRLPIAVPVAENGIGSWFGKVMDTVKSVAPHLSSIPVVGDTLSKAAEAAIGINAVGGKLLKGDLQGAFDKGRQAALKSAPLIKDIQNVIKKANDKKKAKASSKK